MYEDAHQKDDASLESFFSSHTSVGKATIRFMVMTFKALCKAADFTDLSTEPIPLESPSEEQETTLRKPTKQVNISPKLQLNLEIHIAADTSDEKIESIFKNMKKYLLTNDITLRDRQFFLILDPLILEILFSYNFLLFLILFKEIYKRCKYIEWRDRFRRRWNYCFIYIIISIFDLTFFNTIRTNS